MLTDRVTGPGERRMEGGEWRMEGVGSWRLVSGRLAASRVCSGAGWGYVVRRVRQLAVRCGDRQLRATSHFDAAPIHLNADGMRSAIAVGVIGFDADDVMERHLTQEAIERGIGEVPWARVTLPPADPAATSNPVAAGLESRKKLSRRPPREARASSKFRCESPRAC